ncbi:hypothetical protein [Epilithonimonas tenax]|uniref:hypothetical protein n=1 Tax=Epilithonimonas tenax TaxID=191577 RepID=UPI000427A32A|nr:hypothetical protein [Epilithonimonas tenax]
MKNQTSQKTNCSQIDFATNLTSLTSNSNDSDCTAKIKFSGYTDLGYKIFSLIGICQTALNSFDTNSEFTELEKENCLGISSKGIVDILEITKQLLPLPEFELMEQIRQSVLTEQSK